MGKAGLPESPREVKTLLETLRVPLLITYSSTAVPITDDDYDFTGAILRIKIF